MRLPPGFRRTPAPGLGRGDDVSDEIRFHIESRIEELVIQGLPEEEARRRAHAEFGDAEEAARAARRESTRGSGRTRMGRWIDEGLRDALLAVRQLRRNPGFAAAALVTLALGIGGTTAVFSVVDGVLFRRLPYPDEARVVRLWTATEGPQGGRRSWSIPDLDDWRTRSGSLQALGAYSSTLGGLVVPGDGTPEEVRTAYVTAGFFEALGTPAALGRTLPPEAEEDDPRTVVLSDGYWRRHFGADPAVVGSFLDTEAGPFRVVGVMPADFGFPRSDTDLWTFLTNVSQQSVPWRLRQVRVFDAVARLSPGLDPTRASPELAGVARSLAADLPDTNGGLTSAEVLPIRQALVGDVRRPLLLVAGAVGLTLLIACVNVANLLLARGTSRRREFTLRAALGAGGGRLARQLLAESLLLGVVGGAMGAALSTGLVRAFLASSGDLLPRSAAVSVDARVLGFALAASLLTGLVFGLFPALRLARGGGAGLHSTSRGAAGGDGGGVRSALVLAEVALAVVLLVGGGLLMRSFSELRSVDPGFETDGLLVADVIASGVRHSDDYIAFRDRLLDRLEALPGVTGASSAKEFPTRGMGEVWTWALPDDPPALPGEERRSHALHVHRDFFEVMGIPVLAGLPPAEAPELSLVINERLAREAFGSAEAAVGAALDIGAPDPIPVRAVVGDVLHDDPSAAPPSMIYVDDRINARRVFAIVMRTGGDPLTLVQPFQRALAEIDPLQSVRSIYTARSAFDEAVAQPRLFALLMSVFASGAMVLAAVGIYGVIAYSVRRRTREIGVRIALGADVRSVRAMVVREALRPVVPGVILGLVAAAALSSVLTSLLFEVGRLDPVTFGGVGLAVLVVGALAAWGPAREATRVDPQVALRVE